MEYVKVFVSSLFREMLVERDVLHRQVSAMLAEQYKDRDIQIRFVDLRWGINDSEEVDANMRSRFVIDKCLEAIKDSDLFLGLIASGYGSLADSSIGQSLFGEDKEFSYTEIEIKYAETIFPKDKMLFMLTSDSDQDEERARSLKDRIRSSYRYAEYTKEEIVDGKITLDPSFVSGTIGLFKETVKPNNINSIRQEKYFAPAKLSLLKEAEKKNSVVIAVGKKGTGKSTALKLLAEEYAQSGRKVLVNPFRGRSALIDFLKEYVSDSYSFETQIRDLKNYLEKGELKYLFFDSIESIPTTQFFLFYRTIVEAGQDKARLFISVNSETMRNYVSDLDAEEVCFDGLDDAEIEPFMMFIARQYNKTFYKGMCEYVKQHCENAKNAFYLSLLTSRLLILDEAGYQSVYKGEGPFADLMMQEMKKIVDSAPNRLEEIVLWHIRDLDNYIYPAFSSYLFKIMVLYGAPVPLNIAREAYEKLFNRPWSDMDYYTYKYYLRDFLLEENDCISFQYGLVSDLMKDVVDSLEDRKFIKPVYEALVRTGMDPLTRNRLSYTEETDYFARLLTDYTKTEYATEAVLAVFHDAMESMQKAKPLFSVMSRVLKSSDYATVEYWMTSLLNYAAVITDKRLVLSFCEGLYLLLDPTFEGGRSKLLLLTPLFEYAVSFGLEQNTIDLLNALIAFLQKEEEDALVKENADKAADLFYFAAELCFAIDQRELSMALLQRALLAVLSEKTLKPWLPNAMRKFAQGHGSLAIEMTKQLIDAYENQPESAEYTYAELLQVYAKLNFSRKNFDVAVPFAKRVYDAYKKIYDQDKTSLKNCYGYTQGLDVWRWYTIGEKDPHKKDLDVSEAIYTLRNHIAKLAPDNMDYLNALITIVIEIICGDRDVGFSEEEMAESVFCKLTRFAERGNPRAGWLYVQLYQQLVQKKNVAEYLIGKFDNIDLYLNSIIRFNRENTEYLREIVSSFLTIYRTYCEHKILSLEKGELVLDKIIGVAEHLLDLSQSREDYLLYFGVIREVFTVLLQEDPAGFERNKRYIRFKQFAEKEYRERPSAGSKLVYCMIDGLKILPTVYMLQSMQRFDAQQAMIMKMMLSKLNVDKDKILKDMLKKVVETMDEVYKETGFVEVDYVQIAQVAAATLRKYASDAADKQFGSAVMERLNLYSKKD